MLSVRCRLVMPTHINSLSHMLRSLSLKMLVLMLLLLMQQQLVSMLIKAGVSWYQMHWQVHECRVREGWLWR